MNKFNREGDGYIVEGFGLITSEGYGLGIEGNDVFISGDGYASEGYGAA